MSKEKKKRKEEKRQSKKEKKEEEKKELAEIVPRTEVEEDEAKVKVTKKKLEEMPYVYEPSKEVRKKVQKEMGKKPEEMTQEEFQEYRKRMKEEMDIAEKEIQPRSEEWYEEKLKKEVEDTWVETPSSGYSIFIPYDAFDKEKYLERLEKGESPEKLLREFRLDKTAHDRDIRGYGREMFQKALEKYRRGERTLKQAEAEILPRRGASLGDRLKERKKMESVRENCPEIYKRFRKGEFGPIRGKGSTHSKMKMKKAIDLKRKRPEIYEDWVKGKYGTIEEAKTARARGAKSEEEGGLSQEPMRKIEKEKEEKGLSKEKMLERVEEAEEKEKKGFFKRFFKRLLGG